MAFDIPFPPSGRFAANVLFATDNAFDIGAAAANRPRNIYAAGAVRGDTLQVSNQVVISSGGDGVARLFNGAQSGFGRLCLGSATSSFPALKRSSAIVQARLGDDSGFTRMQAILRTHANAVAETPSATHTIQIEDAAGTAYKVLAVAA